MSKKFKNFFSFFAKKKPLLLVFFFIILGIFLPFKPALAVWDWLVGAIQFIPNTTIAVFSLFVASIASLLAALGGVILNYVISPSFTTLSYTNPAGNKLIEVGLGITQGFANMLLVLVLVYIAIATILRLAGYETKKLLVTFIIVALLVNFSPVICGLIVDASNIVMNFFLSELTGSKQLINSFGAIWEGIKEGFDWKKAFTFTGQLDTIFNFLVLAVINLALFLVLLLFAVIFMYRYIAIWILVILSPLAFICYILPATKKYWTMWWNQFIQWSIIGITCGFFLYLAELLASMGTGVYGTASGLGSSFLPHLVPLGFLIMGLVYGLKTAAMGASTIIGLTKKSGGWVGGRIAQRGIKPALERMRAKEVVGKISRWTEKVPVVRWFLPEAVRKYGQMKPAIEKSQQRAKSYSSGTLAHRILKGADTQVDATGNMIEILERGDSQDLFKEAKKLKKWKGKSDQEIVDDKSFQEIFGRPINIAMKGGLHSKALRSDPRLALIAALTGLPGYSDIKDNAGKPLKGEDLKQAAVRKAVGEARAQHIANWEPEVFENKYVIESTLGQFDRERWLQINRQIKRGQEKSLQGIDSAFSDFVDANKLACETTEDLGKAWDKYKEHIKIQNQGLEGYAKALGDARVKQTGWREGGYIPKEERWGARAAPPTTPFGAGMGPPPPTPTPPPGAPKKPPGPPPSGTPKRPPKPPPGAPKRP